MSIADRLVFGTGSLHRILSPRGRQRLLARVLDIGFAHFDVAPAYGNGLCEIELGIAISRCRDRVHVATKFGIPVTLYGSASRLGFTFLRGVDKLLNPRYSAAYDRRDFSRQGIRKSLQGSLRRLRSDYVDTLFVHEPLEPIGELQWQDILSEMDALKTRGLVRQFGIAGPVAPIRALLDGPLLDAVQAPLPDIIAICNEIAATPIAFGIYRAYQREFAQRGTLTEFVEQLSASLPRSRFILSSTRADNVDSLASLFAQ